MQTKTIKSRSAIRSFEVSDEVKKLLVPVNPTGSKRAEASLTNAALREYCQKVISEKAV